MEPHRSAEDTFRLRSLTTHAALVLLLRLIVCQRMEMKRSRSAAIAAVVCVLLLVALSGQVQQAAAMSKFCACFDQCYPACRVHVARFLCVPFCANKCSPRETAAVGGGDPCIGACAAVKICGQSDPPAEAADLASCEENCKKKTSQN